MRHGFGGGDLHVSDLTPKQIVEELDRHIVGQDDAKRAVAIALRNRYRRQQLPESLRDEIQPRNILMIGTTGVGKTEIARRLARLVDAPFIKVEATRFTEVGYVGRDVESIIRDLVEITISSLYSRQMDGVMQQATTRALERLADLVATQRNGDHPDDGRDVELEHQRDVELVRRQLEGEEIDEETVELDLDVEITPLADAPDGAFDDQEQMQLALMDALSEFLPANKQRRRVPIREARRILAVEEAERLVDENAIVDDAIHRVEDLAVVFIDEIDKIVGTESDTNADISGLGVQRDLLPIVEGSQVMTRYGLVSTDHILFIGAGAFQRARPSDLIPELQGRFPIRVELQSLSEDDLYTILTEPENSLTRQYQQLLATEGVMLEFAENGLRAIARMSSQVNRQTEDIGARRLQTIMERVLESLSFDAPELEGSTVTVDESYVLERIEEIVEDEQLSNFIL